MTIEVSLRDNGLWVTINRPDRRNAFTKEMFGDLTSAFERAAREETAKYVMISAVGRDFCAGGDLHELDKIAAIAVASDTAMLADQFDRTTEPWFRAARSVRQPIIVAARGNAIGSGAQMIFAADLVVASATLKIGVPQVKLGHALDHGESISLPRKVGLGVAMEMALLGDPIDADHALRVGLVNRVVEDAALEDHAAQLARRFAASSSVALRENKALLTNAADATRRDGLRAEKDAFARCIAGPDFREAIAAFRERRGPNFA